MYGVLCVAFCKAGKLVCLKFHNIQRKYISLAHIVNITSVTVVQVRKLKSKDMSEIVISADNYSANLKSAFMKRSPHMYSGLKTCISETKIISKIAS